MIRYVSVIGLVATCFCCDTDTFLPHSQCSINCDVHVRIDSGRVCGRIRAAEEDVKYASFRGIPYAQQPLGELRFKELQPVKPWDHILVATEEGPVCPQYDELYSRLAKPMAGMSEACIYVNVHVPVIPAADLGSLNNEFPRTSIPILVVIHGGGFQAGSGNSDLYGPEYLVSKGVMVITFNYRINVFGYLSLNTPKIPGNNALRDMITLLYWVQRNARAFGGDPSDVTLLGHSTGASSAHFLSLSNATKGLFKSVILMSGTAVSGFYTTSPAYAKYVADMFINTLGINSTDPDYIHDELVKMPLHKIEEANRIVEVTTGVISFVPVFESEHFGITRILDDYPENLIKRGRGTNLPMIIGYTAVECETFKRRFIYLDILKILMENPEFIIPRSLMYSVSESQALSLATAMMDRYFKGNATVNKYVKCCTDTGFIYPALKVAEWRAALDGAPVFLYEFSFDSAYNVVKDAMVLQYEGGGAHIEDLTCMFRANAMLRNEKSFPPRNRDDLMKHWMTTFVVNFMRCSNPICDEKSAWPPVDPKLLNHQVIYEPVFIYNNVPLTKEHRDMFDFHDHLAASARNTTAGTKR